MKALKSNVSKSLIFGSLLITTIFISCGKKEPEAPKLSDVFKSQIMKILESGTKLNAATSKGVTYQNFTAALNDVNGAIELADAMWPENFAPSAKQKLKDASDCWGFCSDLWNAKIQDNYKQYDLARNMDQYPKELRDGITLRTDGDGDKFVGNEQLGIGLAISSKMFEAARKEILAELN